MSIQGKYQELFSNELKVLDNAKGCLERFEEHPLHPDYLFLLQSYEKLLKTTKKIFLISDIQGKALKEKQSEIEYLLYHDCLTSLYNRAYINNAVSEMIKSDQLPMSVIFLDVNGLKLMNDAFGHQKGDELLKKVANILKRSIRKSDIAARWGGDEFLVILPKTDVNNCQKIMNRIKINCTLEKNDPIEVSVAVGTATLNREDEDIYDLFAAAEKQMYNNKMLESKKVRQTIIHDLEAIIENETSKHSEHIHRLRMFAERFADILCINDVNEWNDLHLLITLLDIGSFVLPKECSKTLKMLLSDEQEALQMNNEVGYRLARAIGEIKVADAILGFYEHWDGCGYPNKLKGEQIPLFSRMLSILNTFNLKVYCSLGSIEEALYSIDKESGKKFDPKLTQLFLENYLKITNPLS